MHINLPSNKGEEIWFVSFSTILFTKHDTLHSFLLTLKHLALYKLDILEHGDANKKQRPNKQAKCACLSFIVEKSKTISLLFNSNALSPDTQFMAIYDADTKKNMAAILHSCFQWLVYVAHGNRFKIWRDGV